MPAGICFKGETRRVWQDQWSFVFSNFGIKDIWTWEPTTKIYQPATEIQTAADLPTERPLVVITPAEAKHVKGTESLRDFDHPGDAIYMFGGSHDVLTMEDFGGVHAEYLVYIPLVKHECYSFAAAYMTLWDRQVKHG